jgi:Fe-Mn family superoxide dismutase
MMLRNASFMARRSFSSKVISHELPKLPYAYDALQPVLSKELMELHHTKHHAAYVTNLNAALQKQDDLEKVGDVAGLVALQPAIRFNGGGHVNHSIFWTNLAPAGKGGGGSPSGSLSSAIDKRWGSLEAFKTDMTNKAMAIQGSGWAWLSYDNSTKGLTIVTCANQDPCSTTGTVPLLGIDMWEHAFYLSYKNVKANYLKEIWSIINWKNVEERYQAASGGK